MADKQGLPEKIGNVIGLAIVILLAAVFVFAYVFR